MHDLCTFYCPYTSVVHKYTFGPMSHFSLICHWARLQDLIPVHMFVSLLLLEPLL